MGLWNCHEAGWVAEHEASGGAEREKNMETI